MWRTPSAAAAAALLILAMPALGQQDEGTEADSGLRAVMELRQSLYYAGDPLQVRISVGNEGELAVQNPVKGALFKGFVVREPGSDPLKPSAKPGEDEPERPGRLAPGTFYGRVVDLASMYPALRKPGRYGASSPLGGKSVLSHTSRTRQAPKIEEIVSQIPATSEDRSLRRRRSREASR